MFGLFQTPAKPDEKYPVVKTDAQWKASLPPAAYQVLRKDATEAPYSSPLNNEHRKGVFYCLGCQNPLYSSDTKFDSHTGWPSFWAPINKTTAIQTRTDTSMILEVRTEVHCAKCGGHQGHVFNDGPRPTGLRYCMNGASMGFKAA